MPFIDYPMTVNNPYICKFPLSLSRALTNNDIGLLPNAFQQSQKANVKFIVNNKEIYVNNELVTQGIDEAWLSTPLGNDIKCYIPVYGGGNWLPLVDPLQWKVGENVSDVKIPTTQAYNSNDYTAEALDFLTEVEYEDETCLADLVCNAWKYYLDLERGIFVRHPKPYQNAIKGLIRKHITTLTGGTDERLADYGRLILFLLSKVNLTEEELTAIEPLVKFMPDVTKLDDIIKREAFIQTFVSEAKKNPHAFLNWGEDWTNYWWKPQQQ